MVYLIIKKFKIIYLINFFPPTIILAPIELLNTSTELLNTNIVCHNVTATCRDSGKEQ